METNRFVAALNIERLTKQIAGEPDADKRATLSRTLAEEEGKLSLLNAERQKNSN